MMNKFVFLFFLIFLTNSCKSLKQALGVDKDPPDEFLIKKIDPIERPPNYDLLPPDTKIKPRKQASDIAKEIIEKNIKKSSDNSKNVNSNETSSSIENDILDKINKN